MERKHPVFYRTIKNDNHAYTRGKIMQYQDLKAQIKDLTVQSIDGKDIPVESLWADRRVVLAFLRHFG